MIDQASGDPRDAEIHRLQEELEKTLRLAKEATNGWACYATRQSEHDEIARLHQAIDAIAVLT